MNYTNINKLAAAYKTDKTVISSLIQEYSGLISCFCKNIPIAEQSEIKSIFNYQLTLALESYNSKKSQFNTFAYYYLIAVPRIYHSSNTHFNNKRLKVSLQDYDESIDETKLLDLYLDISKILTSEEQLLLTAYSNGKMKRFHPCLEPILNKLITYKRD